jgi:hypothetical protein
VPTGTKFPPGMLLSGWLIAGPRLCRVTVGPCRGFHIGQLGARLLRGVMQFFITLDAMGT